MGCGLSKSRAKKKHLALLLSAFVMLLLLFKVATQFLFLNSSVFGELTLDHCYGFMGP